MDRTETLLSSREKMLCFYDCFLGFFFLLLFFSSRGDSTALGHCFSFFSLINFLVWFSWES